MPTVYRKTAKGTAEVETRAHRLPPRLRGALIVVDGKRPDHELAALMPQAAESLAQLLEGGFIEVATTVAAPPPAPRPVAPPPAPAAPSADAAGPDFLARRRAVLRLFNDLTGPAGESMALKLERTRNLDELRALLPQAVQFVANVRGRGEAEAFAARLDDL